MSRFVLSLALCVCAVVEVTAGDDEDPIRLQLAKDRKAHAEATAKARQTLLSAFDDAIKAVAQSGDLDGVTALKAERKAFEEAGKPPTSGRLRAAAAEHQKIIKQAAAALDKAYEQAVKELTQALKIEEAQAVRAEWKQAPRTAGSEPKSTPVTPAKPAPSSGFSYKFYEWKKGDAPVKMMHKDEGFCYLVGIQGAMAGGGESAQITIEKDGYWYLKGESLTDQPLNLRAVSVKLPQK